jgi:hypothetical protein
MVWSLPPAVSIIAGCLGLKPVSDISDDKIITVMEKNFPH